MRQSIGTPKALAFSSNVLQRVQMALEERIMGAFDMHQELDVLQCLVLVIYAGILGDSSCPQSTQLKSC